jgi:hypothetical protein
VNTIAINLLNPIFALTLTQVLVVWSLVISQFEWSRRPLAKLVTVMIAIPIAVLQFYVGWHLIADETTRQSTDRSTLNVISARAAALASEESRVSTDIANVRARLESLDRTLARLQTAADTLASSINGNNAGQQKLRSELIDGVNEELNAVGYWGGYLDCVSGKGETEQMIARSSVDLDASCRALEDQALKAARTREKESKTHIDRTP